MPATVAPASAHALVRRTPLVAGLGGWLKLESLQRTGSFKLRGAVTALTRLAEAGVGQVIAASAGNHGLGVALAGRALGLRVTLVVPQNAARKKRDGIVALGAELVVEGAGYDDAERVAKTRAARDGLPFVSPFDDDHVIDGNGRWLARELMAQRPSLRRVIAPVGGGGLIAGLLLELGPRGVEVIGVQPEGACAMAESLRRGTPLLSDEGETVCAGLDGGVSQRTFDIARRHGLGIVTVPEAAVLPAVAHAYRALGLVVEPAAAVGIAAVLRASLTLDSECALVITGSNVDDTVLDAALTTAPA